MQTNKIDSDLTKIVALKITDIYNANIGLCTCEKDWTDGECQKIFANYDRYIISTETCWFLKEQLEAFEKVADAVAPHKGTSFYVSVNMCEGYVRLNVGGEDVVKAMWCVRKILRNVKENFQYEERNGPNGTTQIVIKKPDCFLALFALYGGNFLSED